MLLSSFYNAPISYYALIQKSAKDLWIEIFDHYSKQTYRNRCSIMGANGKITLSIPVIKEHGGKMLLKDVRIDNTSGWNKNHWRSIYSAYASAPFFEFIADSFESFYKKKYLFLIDLNMEMLIKTLEFLQWEKAIHKTEYFEHKTKLIDCRECIHPKRSFYHKEFILLDYPYQQVFSERHGFMADITIMDLLFNEGPNSASILARSMVREIE